jgi:hypothetical protein
VCLILCLFQNTPCRPEVNFVETRSVAWNRAHAVVSAYRLLGFCKVTFEMNRNCGYLAFVFKHGVIYKSIHTPVNTLWIKFTRSFVPRELLFYFHLSGPNFIFWIRDRHSSEILGIHIYSILFTPAGFFIHVFMTTLLHYNIAIPMSEWQGRVNKKCAVRLVA